MQSSQSDHAAPGVLRSQSLVDDTSQSLNLALWSRRVGVALGPEPGSVASLQSGAVGRS